MESIVQLIKRLIEEDTLDGYVKQAKRSIFEEKRAGIKPTLFYCFMLHETCEACGEKFPKYGRIATELVLDSGKYMNIRCTCGKVTEVKVSCWWEDSSIEETLLDCEMEIKVADFADLTARYEG